MNVRPMAYHPDLADEICERIAAGETLAAICGPGRTPGMPLPMMVYKWLARYPRFREAYLVARLAQAERWADEVVEIADAAPATDVSERDLRRDRMDARRWRATALAPAKYALELTAIAEPVRPEDEDENLINIGARIAAILEAARRRKEEMEAAASEENGPA